MMESIHRRRFLRTSAAAGCALFGQRLEAAGELKAARRVRRAGALKVTDIETHEILLPYHDFNAETLFRYHGLNVQLRTIYIVRTNQADLEGYGDAWGRPLPGKQIGRFIGTNPFDWLNGTTTLPLNMAMYDLMGKFLGLPAWKLIGPRVRDRVPVAAWTVSQPPSQMAAEVQHATRQGYRWLKYHVDELQNVIDQVTAMQDVAPAGFRVHLDLNASSTFEAIAPLIRKLEKFPVVGRIEDPIVASDPEGWRKLREMSVIPILAHHAPVTFMTRGLCDGLMSGHAAVGAAAKTAALAEAAGTPVMLQNGGGTINQAFLAHQAAVFRMATIDHCNLARLWKDDVANETTPIIDGHIRVPDGPGIGVTLNRQKLGHYESATRPVYRPFLVRIRYRTGPTIYARHDPHRPGATDNLRLLTRLLGEQIPGPVPAYDNDVITDFMDSRHSDRFRQIWEATASGPVVRS